MGDSKIEEIHVKEFLSLVQGVEVYDFDRQCPPEPDFWAETNLGLIGIEHTQLFKVADQNNVLPSLHESEGDRLVDEAKVLFESISDLKIHVSISYRLEYGHAKNKKPIWLSAKKRKELVPIIVDFVLNNIPGDGEFKGFENPNRYGRFILPEEIYDICIKPVANLSTTIWTISYGHTIPDVFSGSNFWGLLSKKNDKISKYKSRYDHLWLVLVSDNRKMSSDFKFYGGEIPKIQSKYSKVFVYLHGDGTIYDIPKK